MINEVLYSEIKMSSLVAEIRVYRITQESVFLGQIQGVPTTETLANDIVAACVEKDHDLSLVVDEEKNN